MKKKKINVKNRAGVRCNRRIGEGVAEEVTYRLSESDIFAHTETKTMTTMIKKKTKNEHVILNEGLWCWGREREREREYNDANTERERERELRSCVRLDS